MTNFSSLCVVDTNVPLVANKHNNVSPKCTMVCIDAIVKITKKGSIVLDSNWEIIHEYGNKLSSSGQPGIGDMFFKWVLTNKYNDKKCVIVDITKSNSQNGYEAFPKDPDLKNFDKSDMKFVAVASKHPDHPPILQAVDSKWWGWKDALKRNGIEVIFLCEEEIIKMYNKKMGSK